MISQKTGKDLKQTFSAYCENFVAGKETKDKL